MWDEILLLEDNWDEDGAPKPSDDAIERARRVVLWMDDVGITPFDLCVDTDVLGGVGVIMWKDKDTRAWVACHNNGYDTIVYDDSQGVRAASWNDEAKTALIAWLRGD